MERIPVTDNIIKVAKNASSSLGIPVHVIVTDDRQVVTYVNQSFESFTGFTKEEVVGRKCNFLQGEGTDPRDLMDMKLAVESRRETNVVILNYTKAHHAFWNTLRIRPMFKKGILQGFVGEIFSLPVSNEWQTSRPRLCLDDALALMRITSAVPRTIVDVSSPHFDDNGQLSTETDSTSSSGDDEDVPEAPRRHSVETSEVQTVEATISLDESGKGGKATVILQRHVNYGARFSTPSPPCSPSSEVDKTKFFFVAETLLPTVHGRFRVRAYRDPVSGAEPLAMIVGDVEGSSDVLCRVHDQCQTSEVFGSLRCDCKEQLDFALAKIQKESGMVLYLPQEGRGIGLANKVAAYAAQELGFDTVDANRHLGLPDDAREYDAVRDILNDLRISSIKLMTNNPRKINEMTALGITVTARVPIVTPPNSDFSLAYVKAKKERMFHMFDGEFVVKGGNQDSAESPKTGEESAGSSVCNS
jgi:GTP cyclohydrolase II